MTFLRQCLLELRAYERGLGRGDASLLETSDAETTPATRDQDRRGPRSRSPAPIPPPRRRWPSPPNTPIAPR